MKLAATLPGHPELAEIRIIETDDGYYTGRDLRGGLLVIRISDLQIVDFLPTLVFATIL